jgi:hypothetical protein
MCCSCRCSIRQISTIVLWTLFALGILHLLAFCALRDAQYSWWFDFHAYKSRLDAEYRHELNLSDVAIECALRREPAHVNANASLCIAVATTRRKGTHYVRVLLGSFLRGTPKAQRDDAIVQLVAAGSAAHPDAEQLAQLPGIQLHRLFPTANVTSLAHSARVDLQLRSILLTTQLCVTHAHRVGAPYFVLLEDDGTPTILLVACTMPSARSTSTTPTGSSSNSSDLFAGFESHDLAWILPLCGMTPLLTFAVARYLLRVAVLRARIAAAIVLVALVGTIGVGRQNLVGWRRGLTPVTEHFSMCAHVYSTRHAQTTGGRRKVEQTSKQLCFFFFLFFVNFVQHPWRPNLKRQLVTN